MLENINGEFNGCEHGAYKNHNIGEKNVRFQFRRVSKRDKEYK
jgi:hypothetical protein